MNTATDTITLNEFHGLVTGDSVTYVAPTVIPPFNPSLFAPVGGLVDGRDYNVVTDAPTQLQLGVEFDASTIDLVNDTITIVGHNFEDGDEVLYRLTTGATGATGLTNGDLYTVEVIDDDTIRLVDPDGDRGRANL